MNIQQAKKYQEMLARKSAPSNKSNVWSGVSNFIAKNAPGFTSWLRTTMNKPVYLSQSQKNALQDVSYGAGKFIKGTRAIPFVGKPISESLFSSYEREQSPYLDVNKYATNFGKLAGSTAELVPAAMLLAGGGKGKIFNKGALSKIPGPIQSIAVRGGTNAVVGAGLNKAFGGSAVEGAKSGFMNAPAINLVGHFTNPFIEKTAGNLYNNLSSPIAKQLITRATTGGLNVLEGLPMDIATGQETTKESVAIDFLSGMVLSNPANAAREQLKSIFSKAIQDNNVDAFEQAVKAAKAANIKIDDVKANEVKNIMSTNKAGGVKAQDIKWQTDDLLSEAKKYKSAEEFIKAQGTPVYHGTNYANARMIQKEGINPEKAGAIQDWMKGNKYSFFTGDEKYAQSYGIQKGGGDTKSGRSFVLAIKSPKDIQIETSTFKKGMKFPDLVSQQKINPENIYIKGIDNKWYPIKEFNFFTGESDTFIGKTKLDELPIKTKSQLTDIWNQANKADGTNTKIETLEQQPTKKIKIKEPYQLKRSKTDKFLTKVKTTFENSAAPIEDILNDYEIKTTSKLLPQNDLRIQFDKVIGSSSIASQWAKDNGLEDIIKDANTRGDLKEFGEYLIARHAPEVEAQGKATGRDLLKDAAFVEAMKPKYEDLAQRVFAYNRKLLDYSVENGIISRAGRDFLVKTYPNYVPFNRILDNPDIINALNSRQIGSISQQRLVRRLIGSELEIQNPLYNMFENTYKAINDIERNKAARIMSQYKDLEGNPFNIREIGNKESIGNKHTFSFLDNGVKRTFEVPKDIEAALKSLDSEEIGTVLRIISIPTRILQMGATGLNLPFVATNYLKDQQFAFITSNKAAQTSFVNPVNVAKGIYYAVGKGDLYEQVVREAGITSQFDIARGDVNKTLESVAAGKNLKSRIAYTAKHPTEILTALENIIGTTEYATRIQQFKGTYDYYIKQGASDETARLFAGQAARENTANFRRSGTLGKYLNKIIPFFNAGIQGAKSLRRAFLKNPKGTSLKVLLTVGIPAAVSTINNLSDEKKKAAYKDIQEWEKDGNFIIIPDNPEKDEQGRWKAIKIPINPGLQGFSNIVRMFIEKGDELDASFVPYVAKNLFNITTSIDLDNPLSEFTPQASKPFIEYGTNESLFTKEEIVPSNMRYLEKEEQVYPWTSGTARAIGKVFNASPIMVEHLVSTVAGGAGKQALNLSDSILNKLGVIPDKQVGGESVFDNIAKRFTLASGGAEEKRVEEEAKKGMTQLEVATYDFIKSYKSKEDKSKMTVGEKEWFKIGENALKLSNPKVSEALRQEAMIKALYNDEPQNPFNMLSEEQRKVVLTINSLPKGEDKSALQKQNIEWLKPYWEANTNYFAYKAVKAYEETGEIMEESKQPIASEYVQRQMDLKNWNDPQVQEYLKANNEYKNYIRLAMGLPALEGYGGGYDPMKYFHPKIKTLKMKKINIKKLPKIKKAKSKKYKKIKTKKISIKPIKPIKIKKQKEIGKIKVRS